MKAVLIASGEPGPADRRWLEAGNFVVAVDAGAAWLAKLGVRPDAVVGDLDSVDPELVRTLEADGVEIERHPSQKDSSDTELAMAYARRRGADQIAVIGAFGGPRIDHEIANVLLLADESAGDVTLVRGWTRVSAVRGMDPHTLNGAPGSLVSLFPVGGDAMGVTTHGLAYQLRDEPLRMGSSRGLSNVVVETPAAVRLRSGTLLVVEQPPEGDETQ